MHSAVCVTGLWGSVCLCVKGGGGGVGGWGEEINRVLNFNILLTAQVTSG